MAKVREPIAWTPTRIALVLGFDRKTVATACGNLEWARKKGRWAYYWLHEVIPVLFGDLGVDSERSLRRKKLEIEVNTANLDYQGRLGNVVDAAGVDKAGFDLGRKIRDRIMQVGYRLAPDLALESNEHTVRMRLDGELRIALESLAAREDDDGPKIAS